MIKDFPCYYAYDCTHHLWLDFHPFSAINMGSHRIIFGHLAPDIPVLIFAIMDGHENLFFMDICLLNHQ